MITFQESHELPCEDKHTTPPNRIEAGRPLTLTVNTIAGGGKTYAALDHAAMLAAMGRKVVIAQPSAKLINQSLDDLTNRHSDTTATRITSETNPGEVTKAIIAHSRSAGEGEGEVLLISHSALLRLPYFFQQQDWSLIVDEAPSATSSVDVDLTVWFTRLLEIKPHGVAHSVISACHKTPLKRIAAGKAGKNALPLQELAALILSKRHAVYALASQLAAAKVNLAGKVSFYSLLNVTALSGWQSTTVMSACLEDTLLHRIWTLRGMQRVEAKRITKRLRANEHCNGPLLSIYYATEADWSKRLRDRGVGGGDALEEMQVAAARLFGEEPSVYLINKDREDTLEGIGGMEKLPNSSHGLNCYQHIHNAAAYSALNLAPAHIAFLSTQGVDADAIRRSIYFSATYQAAMRISLRDPSSKSRKQLIVPDRGCATYIAALFPGSTVALLDTAIRQQAKPVGGHPKTRENNAAKCRAHREKKSTELMRSVVELHASMSARNTDTKPPEEVRGSVSESVAEVGLDIFADIYSALPVGPWPYGGADEFIADLRDLFLPAVYAAKHDNHLISPAHFTADLVEETSRGRANVSYCNGIWLDNDGGGLSPTEFAKLFPHFRIVTYNSFSSTAAKPKFRVFIPTSHLMTAEVYLTITRQIMAVLHGAGYRDAAYLKKDKKSRFFDHGFDVSKLYPENLFYLPCQPGDPSGLIWHDFAGRGRNPLDVFAAIENTILPESPAIDRPRPIIVEPVRAPVSSERMSDQKLRAMAALVASRNSSTTVRLARIEAAVSEWRSSPAGEGHRAFWMLAVKLRYAGLPIDDVREYLETESIYAKSPRERQREIPALIRQIR